MYLFYGFSHHMGKEHGHCLMVASLYLDKKEVRRFRVIKVISVIRVKAIIHLKRRSKRLTEFIMYKKNPMKTYNINN